MSRNVGFAAAATAGVLFALVAGFWQAGSPQIQRLRNADQARLRDLQSISFAVDQYLRNRGQLPQSLMELGIRSTDPETGAAYEYHGVDERRYELCAVFATDNRAATGTQPQRAHGSGRQCFRYPSGG